MQLPGDLIKRGDKIGDGSYGICFRGDFKGIKVVIKELKPRANEDSRVALMREARIMARLRCHRNLPMLIGVDTTRTALVTQFYGTGTSAMTIEQALAQWSHLPVDGLKIARELGDGLQQVHESGIIHNDLHGM